MEYNDPYGGMGFNFSKQFGLNQNMNDMEFNKWAEQNPDAMAKLGADWTNNKDSSGGLFKNWNQQSTANAIQGVGLAANIGFGLENLSLSKKNFRLKKEQHKAWMQDRAEAKTKRDAVSAIRF